MTGIPGIGGFQPVGASGARQAARSGGGFSVGGGTAAGTPASVAGAGLTGLLALQEDAAETVQDRAARRHGHELLAELSALQREILRGPPDPSRLVRLAGLAEHPPPASDAGLAAIVADIALRARIEIIRYSDK